MPTFNAPSPSPRRWPYPVTQAKPGLSRHDLPFTFLVIAIIFGFGALVFPLLGWLRMAKESELKLVAGSVLQAPTLLRPSWPIIRITIETDDGPVNIYEEDMSHSQEIMNLKPGDHVTARVKFLTVGTLHRGSGEYHVYELKRDGVTIESYQDADLCQTRELAQAKTNGLWTGLLSSICLAAALAFRMHFGAW
jgi:hypothetical protein